MNWTQRPTVFVGVDALYRTGPGRGPPLPVPYARPFLHWASHRYAAAWLSRRRFMELAALASSLGLPEDAVAMAGFRHHRHEAMAALRVPWAWVDVSLSPEEADWVARCAPGRFVQVDPATGVTVAHREAVAKLLG